MKILSGLIALTLLAPACAPGRGGVPEPKEIIDLGALVTEDLPERVWGRALLRSFDFNVIVFEHLAAS